MGTGNGGVVAVWRASCLGCLALGVLWLARSDDATLARLAPLRSAAFAALAVAGAMAVGLVPVPSTIGAWLAPGRFDARPAAWGSLALEPERVLDSLAVGALAVAAGVLGGAVGGSIGRRRSLDPLPFALIGVLATAGVHLAVGAQTVWGWVPHLSRVPAFFAPFVNADHFATAVLLLLPPTLAASLDHELSAFRRLAWGAVVLVAVGMVVATKSVAAIGLLGASMIVVSHPWRLNPALVAPLALTVAVAAPWVQALAPQWWHASVLGRWGHVRDAWPMFLDFPLAGVGAGGFGAAFPFYDTDAVFHRLGHLHSEPLQWCVETGVIGVVAGLYALVTVARSRPAGGERGRAVDIGLSAVALHAVVDFPLRLPVLLAAATAVLGWRLTAFGSGDGVDVLRVRRALVGVFAVTLGALAWEVRGVVRDWTTAPVTTVAEQAFPGHPAVRIHMARQQGEAGDKAGATTALLALAADAPHDAEVLIEVGRALTALSAVAEADDVLARAVVRSPADARAWWLRARLASRRGDPVAVEYFARALAASPWNPDLFDEAWKTLPMASIWADELSDAEPYVLVQIGRRAGPDEAEAAVRAFSRAAELEPWRWGDLPDLGVALHQVGRSEEARTMLEGLVERRPDLVRAWLALVRVRREMGDDAGALTAAEVAARSDAGGRIAVVELTERLSGPAAALQRAERWDAEGRMDPALHLLAARLEADLGAPRACLLRIEREGLTEHRTLRRPAKDLALRCQGGP